MSKRIQLSPNTMLFIAIIVIVISLGLIAGGIAYVINTSDKTSNYVKIDATVVNIVEVRTHDSDGGGYKILYSEIVEYTVDGKTYSAQNSSSSSAPKSRGSKIKIAYDPNNPQKCVFVQTTIMVPIIIFVLGAGFGAAGISMVVSHVREQRGSNRKNDDD